MSITNFYVIYYHIKIIYSIYKNFNNYYKLILKYNQSAWPIQLKQIILQVRQISHDILQVQFNQLFIAKIVRDAFVTSHSVL